MSDLFESASPSPAARLPYRLTPLPMLSRETVAAANVAEGLDRGSATRRYEESSAAVHRASTAQSPNEERCRSLVFHPDERVLLAMVGNDTLLQKEEGVQLALVLEAVERAQAEGLLWTPLLDAMASTSILRTKFASGDDGYSRRSSSALHPVLQRLTTPAVPAPAVAGTHPVFRGRRWQRAHGPHVPLAPSLQQLLAPLGDWIAEQAEPDAVLPLLASPVPELRELVARRLTALTPTAFRVLRRHGDLKLHALLARNPALTPEQQDRLLRWEVAPARLLAPRNVTRVAPSYGSRYGSYGGYRSGYAGGYGGSYGPTDNRYEARYRPYPYGPTGTKSASTRPDLRVGQGQRQARERLDEAPNVIRALAERASTEGRVLDPRVLALLADTLRGRPVVWAKSTPAVPGMAGAPPLAPGARHLPHATSGVLVEHPSASNVVECLVAAGSAVPPEALERVILTPAIDAKESLRHRLIGHPSLTVAALEVLAERHTDFSTRKPLARAAGRLQSERVQAALSKSTSPIVAGALVAGETNPRRHVTLLRRALTNDEGLAEVVEGLRTPETYRRLEGVVPGMFDGMLAQYVRHLRGGGHVRPADVTMYFDLLFAMRRLARDPARVAQGLPMAEHGETYVQHWLPRVVEGLVTQRVTSPSHHHYGQTRPAHDTDPELMRARLLAEWVATYEDLITDQVTPDDLPRMLRHPDREVRVAGTRAALIVHRARRAAAARPAIEPEVPVVEVPVVEAPVAEAPVVEAPVVEVPVAEAPVAEAPVVEVPVVEVPVVEVPVAEVPENRTVSGPAETMPGGDAPGATDASSPRAMPGAPTVAQATVAEVTPVAPALGSPGAPAVARPARGARVRRHLRPTPQLTFLDALDRGETPLAPKPWVSTTQLTLPLDPPTPARPPRGRTP